MNFIIGLIIGLFVGAFVGIFTLALFICSGYQEEKDRGQDIEINREEKM